MLHLKRTSISQYGRVVLARGIGSLHSTHCQFAAARLACLKSIAYRHICLCVFPPPKCSVCCHRCNSRLFYCLKKQNEGREDNEKIKKKYRYSDLNVSLEVKNTSDSIDPSYSKFFILSSRSKFVRRILWKDDNLD